MMHTLFRGLKTVPRRQPRLVQPAMRCLSSDATPAAVINSTPRARRAFPWPGKRPMALASGVAMGIGASWYAWRQYTNWYYAYPIDVGRPDKIPDFIEFTTKHARLIELLAADRGEHDNTTVVLSGEQGTGKSLAVSLMLSPEYLVQWFSADPSAMLLNEKIKPYYLGTRPWLRIYAKGSLEDKHNAFFAEAMLTALKKTEEKYPTYIKHPDKAMSWVDVFVSVLSGPDGLKKTMAEFAKSHPYMLAWVFLHRRSSDDEKPVGWRAWLVDVFFDVAVLSELKCKYAEELENRLKKKEEALQEFKQYLEEHPGWVIVLDDIQSLEGVSQYLPEKGGTVLITTNDIGNLGYDKTRVVNFDGFSKEEAIEFLEARLNKDVSATDIESLAEEFKANIARGVFYHPLGLDHACASINDGNVVSVQEYLQCIKENPLHYFSQTSVWRTHLPLVKSLTLMMTFFKKEAETASYGLPLELCLEEKLLFILGSLDYLSIPEELVEGIFCSGDVAREDYLKARQSLVKYRLLEREKIEGGEVRLSMHPLFHRIFRRHFQDELNQAMNLSVLNPKYWYARFRQWWGYETLIDVELRQFFKYQEGLGYQQIDELEPHVLGLEEFVGQLSSVLCQKRGYISLLSYLAGKEGDRPHIPWRLRLLEYQKKYLSYHSAEVVGSLLWLAMYYSHHYGLNNKQKALACFEEALLRLSNVMTSVDDRLRLAVLSNAAAAYHDHGMMLKALDLCDRALALYARLDQYDHFVLREVIIAHSVKGFVCESYDDVNGAFRAIQSIVRLLVGSEYCNKRVSEDYADSLLTVSHNLMWFVDLYLLEGDDGRLVELISFHENILEILKSIDPNSLDTRHTLLLFLSGFFGDTRPLSAEKYLLTYDLGRLRMRLGGKDQLQSARSCFIELKAHLPEMSPFFALRDGVLANIHLAFCYWQLDEKEKAIPLLRESLLIYKKEYAVDDTSNVQLPIDSALTGLDPIDQLLLHDRDLGGLSPVEAFKAWIKEESELLIEEDQSDSLRMTM